MLYNKAALALGLIASAELAASVTLTQYQKGTCKGTSAKCTGIDANVCCQSKKRVFASGTCTGCTSTDIHLTWAMNGRNYCGTNKASVNGGSCISGSSNLRGHSWCRLCNTKRDVDAPACNSTVEPDLLQVNGTWFSVNASVPALDSDILWSFWDDNATYPEIPSYLYKYAIPYNETEEQDFALV